MKSVILIKPENVERFMDDLKNLNKDNSVKYDLTQVTKGIYVLNMSVKGELDKFRG